MATVVVAIALGSCGNGSAKSGSGTWAHDGEFRKFDDVRLKFLSVWNGGKLVPKDQYNNPVAKAIRDKIGVTVEMEGIMMNETEKLNLMFASMDFPDFFHAPYWGGEAGETAVLKKAMDDGLLLDIKPYLDDYPNIKKAYEIGTISQLFYERDINRNGAYYAIPEGTPGSELNIINWGYGVFVRGDVPKALGIDPASIQTSKDLIDMMRAARNYGFKDRNGNPVQIIGTGFHDGWGLQEFLQPFARNQFTDFVLLPDGTVTYNDLTDLWMNSQLFVWQMVNEGLYDVEAFRHTGAQADEKVGNGKALFAGAQFNSSIQATLRTGMYSSNPEMRFTPLGPFLDANNNKFVQYESYGATGSGAIFIPYTEDQEKIHAILTYLEYLNTPEGMELATYGIEGQTFVRNDAGQPRLTPELLQLAASGGDLGEQLRERVGAGYFNLFLAVTAVEWFGEREPGNESATLPELLDWRSRKPIVRREGWPIDSFQSEFPRIDEVRSAFFDGDPGRDYRERAYFAPTKEAARAILEQWQTYLRTYRNGLFMEYVDFIGNQRDRRPDVKF